MNHFTGAQLPQGPLDSPVEQGFQWFSRPYALLDSCASAYGDSFTLGVAGWGLPVVVVSAPEVVREVFGARRGLGAAAGYLVPVLGPDSLFVLDGEAHLRERRGLLPWLSGPILARYAPGIQRTVRDACAQWCGEGMLSLHNGLLELSLKVVLDVMFGAEAARGELLALSDAAAGALSAIGPGVAAVGSQGNAASRAFQDRTRRLRREIHEALRRRASGSRPAEQTGLLEGYLQQRAPGRAAERQASAHALTLLFAGHETTAASLAWALQLLSAHHEVLRLLRAEVDALGSSAIPERVVALPYLSAVVHEVLRLRPVVPVVNRRALCPFGVGGFTVPAGAHIAPAIYIAHHRGLAFSDPGSFRPERFLGGLPSRFVYFPFGGGTRRCTGMALAVLTMKLVLAQVVSAVDVTPCFQRAVAPVRRTVIVAPSEGFPARVCRRTPSDG